MMFNSLYGNPAMGFFIGKVSMIVSLYFLINIQDINCSQTRIDMLLVFMFQKD